MAEAKRKNPIFFEKPLGSTAATWIQDEALMFHEIRYCLEEVFELFVRDMDEEFSFNWSMPQVVNNTWRDSHFRAVHRVERAAKLMRLVSTIHPHLPFNWRLLSKFGSVLSRVEQVGKLEVLIRLELRIAKERGLLSDWIVMRRRLLKPDDAGNSSTTPTEKARQATVEDLKNAMDACKTRGIALTHANLLHILRKEFGLTIGGTQFQAMKSKFGTGGWTGRPR